MSWTIEMTLRNPLDRDLNSTVRKGQVFENEEINSRKQNVAAAKDYSFNIPANSTITVEIEVLCINRRLSVPEGNYNLTNFELGDDFDNQGALWASMDNDD